MKTIWLMVIIMTSGYDSTNKNESVSITTLSYEFETKEDCQTFGYKLMFGEFKDESINYTCIETPKKE